MYYASRAQVLLTAETSVLISEEAHKALAGGSRKRPLDVDSDDEDIKPDFSDLDPRAVEVLDAGEKQHERRLARQRVRQAGTLSES